MKKIKPEDVASELRLLSKNWCLSPEVINIISHGYERICELERERDEARQELCKLTANWTNWKQKEIKESRGWECLKEEADSNNEAFRKGQI